MSRCKVETERCWKVDAEIDDEKAEKSFHSRLAPYSWQDVGQISWPMMLLESVTRRFDDMFARMPEQHIENTWRVQVPLTQQ